MRTAGQLNVQGAGGYMMKIKFYLITFLFLFCFSCEALAEQLTASWYSVEALKRDGQWTKTKGLCADGKTIFDNSAYTCASWDYPLGCKVRVTCQETNKQVVVKVTDRTARRFKGKRIDLSKSAFKELSGGRLDKGLLQVKVERVD